jgi:scyllo-inositol 2-dehydrogenase (NADP+)
MSSKPIKTALLSYGMSGEVFHGPLLDVHEGFEVVSVFHRNRSKQPTHKFPVVNDVNAILNDPSVELVIVNTPDQTHHAYAMDALAAGKHVVVEKPFTLTSGQADEIIALARERKRVLTVFQSRRWDGGFLTVQKILKDKMLGRVVEFEIHYDRYRNYIQEGTWKEQQDLGTGILYNLGSHMLDQVLVLFGKPEYADARIGIQRTGGKVADYYDIRLEYAGLNVIVKSSYLVREAGPMYRINGTEGSFVKYGIDPQEQALKEKQVPGSPGWGADPKEYWGKLNTTFNGKDIDGPLETMPGNYLGFYSNLYDVIRHKAELVVKPEEARNIIRLIEACIESSRGRRAVRVEFE